MNKSENGLTISHGPFVWTKRPQADSLREEVWELSNRPEGVTYFVLKNYGGKPNDITGFSGWRLVSGGPFTDAGGWTSIEDAIPGVTQYLVNHYRDDAMAKIEAAQKVIDAMKTWVGEVVTAGEHLRGGV